MLADERLPLKIGIPTKDGFLPSGWKEFAAKAERQSERLLIAQGKGKNGARAGMP